ncbi:MAG: N-acetylneuraminate synthase family protein [Gammaproteobacteria bacterium]|nr:N-acetylneuraminate synthase family protein [Gammaproteobacteria bacterium]
MTGFPSHIEIEGRRIGNGEPCYIIAEAGVGHFGGLDKAFDLIELAVSAGADVFKTQHYHTDRLVGPSAPDWRDRLRSKELPDAAIARMQQRCRDRGIPFLCTPHDEMALDFLDRELQVPAFKIGSGEVENWPFLANVASRGKPMILSTGMYTLEQIREAVEIIAANGAPPLAILHCVTSYPADPATVNLQVMQQIRQFFPGPVGYSDHTSGTAVPLAAVALGANLIEKHITIDKNVPNAQDWKVSCDPATFGPFVRDVRDIESALGGGSKRIGDAEQRAVQWARKSLTAARDITPGERLVPELLLAQRPGSGLPPSNLARVAQRRARVTIPAGTPITEDMLQ